MTVWISLKELLVVATVVCVHQGCATGVRHEQTSLKSAANKLGNITVTRCPSGNASVSVGNLYFQHLGMPYLNA